MIAFRVNINGKHPVTVGLEQGNFNLIVTRATSDRRSKSVGYTRLNLGGLQTRKDGTLEFVNWLDKKLKAGDRLTLEVISATDVDPPKKIRRQSTKQTEKDERAYYEMLKRKYE